MSSKKKEAKDLTKRDSLLRKVCEQRDAMEKALRGMIEACNAAIVANAYAKGKDRYKVGVACSVLAAVKVLQEEHPEQPHYDFSALPEIKKRKKYSCSPQWFYRNLVGILLEIPIGRTIPPVKARRYAKALQTMKHIGMDTIGYGHTWYDDETLQEDVIKEFSKTKGFYPDFTQPMPLHHIVYELNRFLQDYNPTLPYEWYENNVHREVQQALICACLVTAGVDPTNTYEVYEYLTKPLPKKSLRIR